MAGIVDTLKYFEKLRAAGLDERAARAIAEGQFEAIAGSFATKADLAITKADLQTAIQSVRTELQALRTEVKGDIGSLRAELKGDIGSLNGWIKGLYVYVTLAIALVAALAHWRLI